MPEVAIIAWIAAAVLAVVVLSFCTYEVVWKARRLQSDLERLQSTAGRVNALQVELAAARERLTRTGPG